VIVADTNLVAYLLIDGALTGQARRVWQRDPEWVVPPLWRSELLSVLATTVRAGVLTEDQAVRVWANAADVFGRREREPTGEAVLRTALRYRISAYDAQFVVVAEQLKVALVTADRKLLRACGKIAVPLQQFARA
jgi:predicted nucleic acid-binding protein